MARRLTGQIVHLGTPRIAYGGSIKVDHIEIKNEDGSIKVLSGYSMDRKIFNKLHHLAAGTFYFSSLWGNIYGLRLHGSTSEFESAYVSPWLLLMSVGMLFGGLATSAFLFPLLIAIAGLAGILICVDARAARRSFRRDEGNSDELRRQGGTR